MTTDVINYLAPHLREHPDARAFCEALDAEMPDGWGPSDFNYAWEADIPPRGEWERHAAEFAASVRELQSEQDADERGLDAQE
jgi:hypothetical protein